MRRAEKGAEFRDNGYRNGYKDNNSYLEKSKACYCCCKGGKETDF